MIVSQTLWTDYQSEEGIDLGDPFHLLADWAAMAHACGERYDRWPELFSVPGATMDGEDVTPEWMVLVARQAHDFLARYAADLSPRARGTLQLLADSGDITEAIRRDRRGYRYCTDDNTGHRVKCDPGEVKAAGHMVHTAQQVADHLTRLKGGEITADHVQEAARMMATLTVAELRQVNRATQAKAGSAKTHRALMDAIKEKLLGVKPEVKQEPKQEPKPQEKALAPAPVQAATVKKPAVKEVPPHVEKKRAEVEGYLHDEVMPALDRLYNMPQAEAEAIHRQILAEAERKLEALDLASMNKEDLVALGRSMSRYVVGQNKAGLIDQIRRIILEPIEMFVRGAG